MKVHSEAWDGAGRSAPVPRLATQLLSLLAVHWWPYKVCRECTHPAELGLSPSPWDLSHSSCLPFILGENPPKQQSVFEL